jgi:hypothetical protein
MDWIKLDGIQKPGSVILNPFVLCIIEPNFLNSWKHYDHFKGVFGRDQFRSCQCSRKSREWNQSALF